MTDELTVLCEPLQRTHLQRSLLRMSPTAGDETSRGRNPENGRRRDFERRRRHRRSGFQHTDRPRPSSPELFSKDHVNIWCIFKAPVRPSSQNYNVVTSKLKNYYVFTKLQLILINYNSQKSLSFKTVCTYLYERNYSEHKNV